jgi:hypothetical protein
MKTNIKQLNPAPAEPTQSLAVVTAAIDGEATHVCLHGMETPMEVVGLASHLPPLEAGDTVMVVLVATGAVVSFRLRRPGERPREGFSVKADGSLGVTSAQTISIRTPNAFIELRADGRLRVDGREIYAIADGLHRLQGATIELN